MNFKDSEDHPPEEVRHSTSSTRESAWIKSPPPDNGILKAGSSQWLVEDLAPATMISVDDTPPSVSTFDTEDTPEVAIATVGVTQFDLDPDDSDFLATLAAAQERPEASEPVLPSTSSIEVKDTTSEDPAELQREFETCGFSIGSAVDKNKRYRRTMEVKSVYSYFKGCALLFLRF